MTTATNAQDATNNAANEEAKGAEQPKAAEAPKESLWNRMKAKAKAATTPTPRNRGMIHAEASKAVKEDTDTSFAERRATALIDLVDTYATFKSFPANAWILRLIDYTRMYILRNPGAVGMVVFGEELTTQLKTVNASGGLDSANKAVDLIDSIIKLLSVKSTVSKETMDKYYKGKDKLLHAETGAILKEMRSMVRYTNVPPQWSLINLGMPTVELRAPRKSVDIDPVQSMHDGELIAV
jgi:uncharacterized protein (DUF952 family)